jgi:hypothetical protein
MPGTQAAGIRRVVSTLQRCFVWDIEQVFRSMKSDCLRIEDSQMEDANCFTKLAVVGLIAATRSMQIVMARDGSTSQPVTDAADPADMPALRSAQYQPGRAHRETQEPHDESLLAWYAWIVVRLGGWSGRTSRGYRPPGPKTMHHGLLRLAPILARLGAWRTVPQMYDSGRALPGDIYLTLCSSGASKRQTTTSGAIWIADLSTPTALAQSDQVKFIFDSAIWDRPTRSIP